MKYGESVEGLEWLSENVVIFQGHKTKLTPMIDQYLDAKKQNPNAVLFFRMGDFYECFFDDAKTVSKALDLVLTARTKNEDGDDLPMAGVPVRSVNEYLFQLVEQGFRVAICEQLELPTPGVSLVKRGITQVVTPGTLCDERPGFDKSARFLSAIVWREDVEYHSKKRPSSQILCALASLDLSTGYCTMTEIASESGVQTELLRMNVREIITHHGAHDEISPKLFCGIPVSYCDRDVFNQQSIIDHWMNEEDGQNVIDRKSVV